MQRGGTGGDGHLRRDRRQPNHDVRLLHGDLASTTDPLGRTTKRFTDGGGRRLPLTDPLGYRTKYTYDDLDNLNSIVDARGKTTSFLYDGLNPVQEQNNSGTVTGNLITGLGLDQTYQRTTGGTSYNFLTDVLGSTVALVAGSAVSNEFTYKAYGTTTKTGSGTHPYRFTGREWDGATGLQYNRARYYNPTWGRFVGEDPVGPRGSRQNAYAYASADPVELVDPSGLDSCAMGRRAAGVSGTMAAISLVFNQLADLEFGVLLTFPWVARR